MDPANPPRRRGRPRNPTPPESGAVQALDRGLEVLGALAETGAGVTLTALAARLGQPVSSLHRMLATLQRRGLADLDPAGQTWHVGAEAFRIGSAFIRRSALVERARPILQALMEETGETANLGVARGHSVLFLAQAETPEILRAYIPPGTLAPLHASGIGKALLAHRPAGEVRDMAAAGLERFTPRTLVTAAELAVALEAVRAKGMALDDEERSPGMRCVAAAVFDMTGQAIAGLSVSGPLARMGDAHLPEVGVRVRRRAAELSRAMGAAVPPGP